MQLAADADTSATGCLGWRTSAGGYHRASGPFGGRADRSGGRQAMSAEGTGAW